MDQNKPAGLTQPQFFVAGAPDSGESRAIAYRYRAAAGSTRPGLVWFGGFRSDMLATKASALDDYAAAHGRAMLRFDYSGHGESGGRFEEGTISRWLEESLAVLRAKTSGPQILIGSSMGGWLALLAAQALHAAGDDRVAGLVLIAPAVDFTEGLLWDGLDEATKKQINEQGVWLRPSAYSPEPVPITRALIRDGRRHLLLGAPLRSYAPVHILQGMADEDVPWRHAMRLVEHLVGDSVVVTLIRDGDHRLSRPQDIARLIAAVEEMG
ncbi:MAG: alpha/beta hydrolase [Beijerinckiaceae bacterium]|jgi:pimeloyl-ACP methyl ester carboxylesterase